MQLHVALLRKRLGAQLALVGPLAGVNAVMTVQSLLVNARIAAQMALIVAHVCCQEFLARGLATTLNNTCKKERYVH